MSPRKEIVKEKPKVREREVKIYEDNTYILTADSRNYIVSIKGSEQNFYYSELYYFIKFLVDKIFKDKLITDGLTSTLNSLDSLYRDAHKQITTIVDSIAEVSSKIKENSET